MLYRCFFLEEYDIMHVIKFDNFIQKLFNLRSRLLLKDALKQLPRQIFASLLYHYDEFVRKYSGTHCICIALKQCLQEFQYSDTQFCQWIACVRVDYAQRNAVYNEQIRQFSSAKLNNTEIISAINSLHIKYEKI